ncbi:MAG: hypothetical protein J6U93_06900 [Alistipes sp.]|nr:hypothetical protein [Alistipes sp.]
MKRLLSFVSLCCLIFVACSNEDGLDNGRPTPNESITLSQTVVEVGFEPDTYSVSVTSPYSWDATAKNDWIVLNTTSGTAGTKELQFITKRNYKKEVREGTIVIQNKDAGLYAELSVVQEALCVDIPVVGIDLGLSVKWASCNVGAERPEEYGDYFAWGEISPKDEYTTQTYQYWTDYNGGGFGDLGEYAKLGDISGRPQYDAATANWGGDWRMPTKSELQELLDDCTWEWTALNGVNGQKVTGPNGNSIFLPATGGRYDTSSLEVGSVGYYWSSTPDEDGVDDVYRLRFFSGYYTRVWGVRYYGQSVRPVLE